MRRHLWCDSEASMRACIALICLLRSARGLVAPPTRCIATPSGALRTRHAPALAAARTRLALKPTAAEEEEEELSIVGLLERYGVVALVFHFTVWVATLSTVFLALSVGDPAALLALLPSFIRDAVAEDNGSLDAAAKLPVALALCEVVGPARLALTLAATPPLSERARRNDAFVRVEAAILAAVPGRDA